MILGIRQVAFALVSSSCMAMAVMGHAFPGARPPSGGSSSSTTTLLVCVVPNEDARQPQVALRMASSPSGASEVVTVTLIEGTRVSVMSTQAAASEARTALAKGEFSSVLLKEDFSLQNGVMLNAGFIAVSPGQDQILEGFLAANGSVYPLSCKLP